MTFVRRSMVALKMIHPDVTYHSESRNRVTQAPGPTPDSWVNLGEAQIREIVLIENEQFHDLFWDIYSFLSV